MQIIEPKVKILKFPETALADIETAARTCYKSEDKTAPGSAPHLVERLVKCGHHAMIEFADATVRFTISRAVSHELVRHRHCSFAQESQRYVNYRDRGLTFIKPYWAEKYPDQHARWEKTLEHIEQVYQFEMIAKGMSPQAARDILPNSTATEIVVKANLREWRHIFSLRCSAAAYPAMRQVMLPLCMEFAARCPSVFPLSLIEPFTPGTLPSKGLNYEHGNVSYLEGCHD